MVRKLHIVGIHNSYTLPDIIMVIPHEDEIDWACCTHERDGKCVQNFSLETSREKTVWEV